MKELFRFSIDVMAAFYQVGMLVGGVLCLAFGGLMLGHWCYYRLRGTKADGVIIGIRQRGASYYPVYRYCLAPGQSVEANASTGSSDPTAMTTGKIVPLLVMPDQHGIALEARQGFLNAVGALLIIMGIALFYIALTSYPVTALTWAVCALFGLRTLLKLYRLLRSQAKSQTLTVQKLKNQTAIQAIPIQTLDQILAMPAGTAFMQTRRRGQRQTRPLLAIFGALCLAGGLYLGTQLRDLQDTGRRISGQVVGFEISDDVNHPMVRFTGQDGTIYQFKDKTGSNLPAYQLNETVTVLYRADALQQSAMIDRGHWNWLLPGLLCGGGGAMILGALLMRGKTHVVAL